jgi:hypothetical protein
MVKRKENIIRSERMATNLVENNSRCFWQEVRALRGKNAKKLPNTVDGISGNDKIAELFAEKFKNIFNSVGYDPDSCADVINECTKRSGQMSDDTVENCLMRYCDISKIVQKLKCGKSDGQIGLYSDHVIHGSTLLFEHLLKLFNCMLIHGMSPHMMLVGTTIPIPKNRKINDSDNFRGICLQSVSCKMMDLFMLEKEQKKLGVQIYNLDLNISILQVWQMRWSLRQSIIIEEVKYIYLH